MRRLDAMMRGAALRSCRSRRGFTIIELIVGLTLGLIVLTSVYQLLMSQSRLYGVQREAMDTRQSLRAAAALLSYELQALATIAGDFYAIGPSSLTMRSLQGTGVVCSMGTMGVNKRRFGLRQASGYFQGTATGVDSVMVYDMLAMPFGEWNVHKVKDAWNGTDSWLGPPSGGGTPVCFWGDSSVNVPRPQATVQLAAPTAQLASIRVGDPVRAFRPTEFALFQQAGRSWLGRKVIGDANYEILTGPLLPASDSGLVFTYYDATGAVTADPSQVAQVEIVLRAESFGAASGAGYKTLRDSLTTRVFLRGNPAP